MPKTEKKPTSKSKKAKSLTLGHLLERASQEALVELVQTLCHRQKDVQFKCMDFLKTHVDLGEDEKVVVAGNALELLWKELHPILEKANNYGYVNEKQEKTLTKGLVALAKQLKQPEITFEKRWSIIEAILGFQNTSFQDALVQLTLDVCQDDTDRNQLAEHYQKMRGSDWSRSYFIGLARDLYRLTGENEKYLALRQASLHLGDDYYDLASFYLEQGDPQKAIQVAEEGMKQGQGNKTNLRSFLAKLLLKDGKSQKRALDLIFQNMITHLSPESYREFQARCSVKEWEKYETDLLKRLPRYDAATQAAIYMERQDFDQALLVLTTPRKNNYSFNKEDILPPIEPLLPYAIELESHFPEELIKLYQAHLRALQISFYAGRSVYHLMAKITLRIQAVYCDILKKPKRWSEYTTLLKMQNVKRPAFQEIFNKTIPGWIDL